MPPIALNSDGSWREPPASIGEQLERERLEKDRLEYLAGSQEQQIGELQGELDRLRDWTGGDADGEANVALSSLLRIVGSNNASMRQRLKASAAILGYAAPDEAAEFVKKFLRSVAAGNADISTDYRIEASELLRRHEAPRVTPENVRPAYRTDDEPAPEPPEPLADLVARQRKRCDEMQAAMERDIARDRALHLGAGRSTNGNGETDTSS